MLHIKRVQDLEELHTLTFSPPPALMDLIEEASGRGEEWGIILAYQDASEEPLWVMIAQEPEASLLFLDGERWSGRWDQEHEIFIPEEGASRDLSGHPVSLLTIEEDEEEEDAEDEESKR